MASEIRLYFIIRSLAVVEESDGEALTCKQQSDSDINGGDIINVYEISGQQKLTLEVREIQSRRQ